MLKVKVVNEEELSNIMIDMVNVETFSIDCAFINIGDHPELGKVIGVAGDSGKSALVTIT